MDLHGKWLVNVNCITMISQWARWHLKSPASRLFTQPFIQAKLKKTSKLRVTGLCAGNSPVIGEFHAQRASNAENVSIWWRHHVHEYQTSYFSFSVEVYASQPAILGFEIYLRPNPRNIVILSKFSSLAGNGRTGSWQNDNFRFSKRQFFSARRWYSRSNVMVQKYPSLHVFVTTVLYAKNALYFTALFYSANA